jgi:hypothetical protein
MAVTMAGDSQMERQESERKLLELRDYIGLARQRVAEGQALIDNLERDLAAAAADLGVPAWSA